MMTADELIERAEMGEVIGDGSEQMRALVEELRATRAGDSMHVWDDYCEAVRLVTRYSKDRPTLTRRVQAALDELDQLRNVGQKCDSERLRESVSSEVALLRGVVDAVVFLQIHVRRNLGGQAFAPIWESVWEEFEQRLSEQFEAGVGELIGEGEG